MKLHLICGKGDLRQIMQYVKVTKEELVATNGHVLGIIPTTDVFNEEFIEGIPDKGMLIHREDWAKIIAAEIVAWKSDDIIRCVNKKRSGSDRPLKRDVLVEVESEDKIGNYVNWMSVIPEMNGFELNEIGIDFKLAATLQEALGLDSCRLNFVDRTKAILITDANSPLRTSPEVGSGTSQEFGSGIFEGRRGLVMPTLT